MVPSILDKVLRALIPSESQAVMGRMVRASEQPQFVRMSIEELREEIDGFERATGMTTAEMRLGVALGTVRETDSIHEWIMSAEILEDLLKLQDGEGSVGCG